MVRGGNLRQYIVASSLGVTPGCLGAFASVSLYVRGFITFGALVAAMIATSGDEAFVMLKLFPKQALILNAFLFVCAVVTGMLVEKLFSICHLNKQLCVCARGSLHNEDENYNLSFGNIALSIRKMSFARFLLIVLFSFFAWGFIFARFGPKEWGWERVSSLSLSILSLFISLIVSEHYLEKHIWSHIIKQHLWRVFLWSFFALAIIGAGLKGFNLGHIIQSHIASLILIAALVGIIPESGPHLIFAMMFFKGLIPFSVLVTSSIVQDGHGMLPLLSFSIKTSLWVKLVNFIVGLTVGYALYAMGV